jgi:nitrite reductase/ring-hydroxylating ferredoxin subunit
MAWVDVLSEAELATKSKAIVRVEGRQILLLKTERGIFACNNRCPHEGYPLSEGVLSAGCILTCNWHNWKFDLESGATLIGGDVLPRYKVKLEDGRILLDIQPIDPAERHASILNGIRQALDDADEQRLVRETARLVRLGADPLDAVRAGIIWACDRLQYGTTHAIAGAPDWIRLAHDTTPGSAEALAALGEILGHLAEDARPTRHYPFPAGDREWDEGGFLEAIEREDEASPIAMLRGALRIGHRPADLAPVLYRVALAHYADFGHALIYTAKTIELSERLGPALDEIVLALLVRSLVLPRGKTGCPNFGGTRSSLMAGGGWRLRHRRSIPSLCTERHRQAPWR